MEIKMPSHIKHVCVPCLLLLFLSTTQGSRQVYPDYYAYEAGTITTESQMTKNPSTVSSSQPSGFTDDGKQNLPPGILKMLYALKDHESSHNPDRDQARELGELVDMLSDLRYPRMHSNNL